MDQEIVDQLTLDSIPYYEEQLCGALQVIIDLQQKVEQHDLILDDDTSNENLAEDQEADFTEIIASIQQQQFKELQDIDEINQKQQDDFEMLFQELHKLELSINQMNSEANQDEQYVKNTTKSIKQKQEELKLLSEQYMLQNINNKENLRIIEQLQEKLLSDEVIINNNDSLNQVETSKKQTFFHQRSVSQDMDQIKFVEMTSYKQQLENELEQILNQPKPIKIDASTQTHHYEFPQKLNKSNYDDIGTANSCVQQTFSNLNTPKNSYKNSQILLHTLLKEDRQRKGCCSDCRIY